MLIEFPKSDRNLSKRVAAHKTRLLLFGFGLSGGIFMLKGGEGQVNEDQSCCSQAQLLQEQLSSANAQPQAAQEEAVELSSAQQQLQERLAEAESATADAQSAAEAAQQELHLLSEQAEAGQAERQELGAQLAAAAAEKQQAQDELAAARERADGCVSWLYSAALGHWWCTLDSSMVALVMGRGDRRTLLLALQCHFCQTTDQNRG